MIDRAYFDAIIDRAGTACEKWDGRETVFGRKDVIPLWVADMDFACAPGIVKALKARAAHPIYGYTDDVAENRLAEVNFLKRRFDLTVEPEWILSCPSVVDSMLFSLYALTAPGERVLIQPPVYGPFRETILRSGRAVAESPLLETAEGWKMDFASLEAAFKSGHKVHVPVQPAQPRGRVWTRAELEQLALLVKAYRVRVIADEIHASFTFAPHVHTPLRTLLPDTIMLTSATKAFNIAGVRQSSIIVSDEEAREALKKEMHSVNADHPNLFAMVAQRAAYETGDEWLDGCVDYIRENRDLVCAFMAERLPEVSMPPLEGTYLMWLDMRRTGIGTRGALPPPHRRGRRRPQHGPVLRRAGRGFFRLNLATQRQNVQAGLEGIERALRS